MNPAQDPEAEQVPGLACGAEPESPNGRGFIALLEALRASGGTAPSDIVSRLFEDRQAGQGVRLAQLIQAGEVFGFAWRAKLWIPMFQFHELDLALKPGPQQVRQALPSQWSGWTLASWFSAAHPRLEGRSPANTLDLDLEAVLQAAHAQEPLEAWALPLLRRGHDMAVHA